MTFSAHQPGFIPYLGFFHKFKKSNIFVLSDISQYTTHGWQNRNKIKTANGPQWLTIPVSAKYQQTINTVEVANHQWIRKHLATIELSYKKAKYFDMYYPEIEKIYLSCRNESKLVKISENFLRYFFEIINPKTTVLLASELHEIDWNKKATEAIISMCKVVKAKKYVTGPGAREYLNESLFINHGIELEWQSFCHPIYDQLWGKFCPNLSVLDSLFNTGTNLKELI